MKKFFTLFIILILLPVTALADGVKAPDKLYVGGTLVSSYADGTTWTTDDEGNLTTPTENDNWNVKYEPSSATLTLKDATIKGGSTDDSFGAGIYAVSSTGSDVALTINLEGTSTVSGDYGIYVQANQNSTPGGNSALLTISGDGTLTATGSSNHGIAVYGYNGGAALTIENATVNASTSANYAAGVLVYSGSEASDSPQLSLTVKGGSLTASGGTSSDGILFYVGSPNATATTSLTVSGNAIVDAKTGGISATQDLSPIDTTISSSTTDSNGGIVWDGKDGTVYGEVTLDESLTINQGETLTIPDGSKLDCNNNLTNNGTILVESGGSVSGNLSGGTTPTMPTITTHPQAQEVQAGSTATFTVATDSSNPSYQWQQSTDSGQNWADISGANADSYTTAVTTTGMSGYQYRCVVKSASGVSVISQAATLTVQAKPASVSVTGVSLDKATLELFTGNTATLTATVTPDNATNQAVTWQSDNANVATVQNGTVTAVGAGETTITVTTEDGGKTATCKVKVTVPVTGVKLDKETLELYTGDSETLTATVQPDNATNQTVTWSSDKPKVATVDDDGKVTAKDIGDATITVTADGGKTATCEVKVRNQVEVKPSGSANLSFTTDRDEFTLTARVYGNDLDLANAKWTWTVADKDVVALSGSPTWRSQSYSISRQTFTVEGTGTTTITATYDDGKYRGSVGFSVRISKPTPPDPISYYNIYVEDVCDGVEVTTSKNVVREGGSVSVYVKKDTANYTFDNFKVYYKRSYYGGWEELKEGTQPGEYPIKNIWTHIYIKAEGTEEKEDPTGIESIEGVKVYTKDGSLYVQTPQREQVIIVSMTGVVVKNEEQIGLKQYHGLQPGIYIVRVGDRAYKLRLH